MEEGRISYSFTNLLQLKSYLVLSYARNGPLFILFTGRVTLFSLYLFFFVSY